MTAYTPPGRLGEPNMSLASDPRLRPALRKSLKKLGVADAPILPFLEFNKEVIYPWIAEADKLNDGFYDAMGLDLPEDAAEAEVDITDESWTTFDGTERELKVFRRADTAGKILPGVLYIHGGGMVMSRTFHKVHMRWCKSLALQGLVVILPDFRNAYNPELYSPFPTGLNDVTAALKHVAANKEHYGISKLIVQGESGGGNLALSTTLKAKREGFLDLIDGTYAVCPYIANGASWSSERKVKELPSYIENEGYFLQAATMAAYGWYYGADSEDPHAWPYYAAVEDMKGLPPHVLVMDELDPLRDEGIAYSRKLLEAGVTAQGSVCLGTIHGTALLFRQEAPENHRAVVRDIAAFAKEL